LVLSISSEILKDTQNRQQSIDQKRNILQVLDIIIAGKDHNDSEIEKIYKANVKASLINHKGEAASSVQDTLKVDVEKEFDKEISESVYPVFVLFKKKRAQAYCFPIYGKGLWASIYGYIALEKDLRTVRGITFYKQGETPGLGAEVKSSRFTHNFKGKKILDEEGNLISITVVKGSVDNSLPQSIYQVDGITGATYTSNSVTKLLKKSLIIYMPYIKQKITR
jgi:Na+-transporting NADH:ubiquinone oxidoreductase subunit C